MQPKGRKEGRQTEGGHRNSKTIPNRQRTDLRGFVGETGGGKKRIDASRKRTIQGIEEGAGTEGSKSWPPHIHRRPVRAAGVKGEIRSENVNKAGRGKDAGRTGPRENKRRSS